VNPYDDVFDEMEKSQDDIRSDVVTRNPYDDIYKEAENLINVRQNVSAVKASMTEAAKARRDRELAERAKLPTDIVAEAPEIVSQSLKAQDINSNLLLFTPEEREFLSSLDRLPAIQDDLPQLNALSKAIQNPEWYAQTEWEKWEGAIRKGGLRVFDASQIMSASTSVDAIQVYQKLAEVEASGGNALDWVGQNRDQLLQDGTYRSFQNAARIGGERRNSILQAHRASLPTRAARLATSREMLNAIPFDPGTPERLETVGDAFSAVINEPGWAGRELTTTLVGSSPSLILGWLTGGLGWGGRAASAVAGSYPMEYSMKILEVLEAEGYDLSDPDVIIAALTDPAAMEEALFKAERKASGTSAVDAVLAMTAGTNLIPRSFRGRPISGGRREAANQVLQVPIQGLGEAGGDALGTALAGDELVAGEIALEGILGAGTGPIEVLAYSAGRYRQAARDRKFLGAMNEMVAELQKGNASKDDIRGLVALAKKNGQVQDVFINAADLRDALDQAGLFPESIMEQMPDEVRQQYEQQLEIGGDVVIPLEYYASVLAETAAAEQIANMSRTVADGINVTDGKKWVDEQARPMVERLINFDPEQDRGPMDQVVQDLTGQMVAVGYDPNVAEAEAQRMALMFGRIAAMAGMDAKALYDQVGLQIRREPTEAQRRRRATSQLDEMLDRLRTGDIPADRDIFGPSLLDFIREQGGIVDEGGELAAMDANVGTRVRRRDGQIQPTRNSPIARSLEEGARLPDDMAEAAWEAGYIAERDPNLLMSRIDEELRGNPVFAMGSENAEMQNLVADLEQISDELRRIGLDIGTMTNDEIIAELQRIAAEPAGEQLNQQVDDYQGPPRSYEELIADEVKAVRKKEMDEAGIQYTEDQLNKIASQAQPRMDEVTGAYSREARRVLMAEAMRVVRNGGTAQYISMDFANWSGLNQEGGTGDVDTMLFRPGVDIIREELAKTGASVSLIRQGGDEVSAVIIGVETAVAEAAVDSAAIRFHNEIVMDLATVGGVPVTELPNPKGGPPGTTLYRVTADVPPTGDLDSYIKMVDARVESEKKQRKGILEDEAKSVGLVRISEQNALAVAERIANEAGSGDAGGRSAARDDEAGADVSGGSPAGGASSLSDTANRLLQSALAARAEREQLEQAGVPFAEYSGEDGRSDAVVKLRSELSEQGENVLFQESAPVDQTGDVDALVADLVDAASEFNAADESKLWETDGDAYMAMSERIGSAQEALADAVAAMPDAGFGVQAATSDGRGLMITPSAQQPGKWQLTRMGKDGAPWGDTQHDTKKQAVMDMLSEADPASIQVFGNRGTFNDSGNILEQQQNQSGARGSFFYDAMGKAVIQLGQASDLTTLPHESYHLFLDVMASLRDTSTELAGELDTVRKWLSGNVADLRRDAISYAKKSKADQVVAEIEAMTDEQLKDFYAGRDLSLATLPAAGADRYLSVAGLEYFARAGEAYLLEGKAPSAETAGLFRRLKQWFLMVYRTAKDLKVNLSPEIVGLFNRMLATEEQITQAQELAGYGTSLADVDGIQWTDQERELIAKLTGQARDEAERQLMIEQLRDMKKQQQGWWAEEADKIRREVLDDLNRDPAYQVRQMLTAGKRGDGSALPDGVEPIKLNKKALVDEFGEAYMKRLPSPRNPDNRAPGYVYSAEGGVDPKIVARMYGFDSVREMVEALINSRPVKAYVDGLVNSEMRTRYPDINLSGEAAQIAREKVQNDKQAELMLAELKKLEQVQGKSVTPVQLYKEKARQIVAGLKIRHLSPATHRANAEKYQKIATREAVAGKLAEALEAKQKALIHHYVYREALRAEQEADRVYKLAKRLSGKSAQETIGKAGADYLERINEILDRYEFRRVSGRQLERRESMREWMKSKQEAGDYVDIPDEVLDRVQRVNYRDVTIDELAAVRDAVKNLEHVARFKSKLLADKKQRDLQEVVDAVVARLGQTQKKRKGKMFFQQKSWADKMLEAGQDYAAIALNMDSIISQLDGFEDIGPVYDAIKRPIDEAARTRLPAMQQEYGDKLAEIYNRRFTRKEQRAMQDGYVELPGRGMISREEALSVALNTGNRYNREALTSGIASGGADQLTEADIKAVLNGLNKADWDFVQDVWDLLDYDLWPQVKEAQKRRTGVAPEKVEAEPVVTRFGVYRGGYYPVKFDTQLGWRVTAQEAEQMAQEVRMGQFAKASTKRGHTQARTNTAQQPLKLDLPVLHGHVNQVITDLALGDAVNDVARVVAHKDFVSAMEASGNQWVLRALDLWLKDTAAQEVVASDIASRFGRRVRTGFTISKLAWNLSTILLQPTGLAQSVPDVGYKHLRQAMATVIRSDWTGDNNVVAQVRARSKFMATRGASFNKDIQVTMNAMKGSGWIESLLERTPWIKNIADGAGPQKASEMIKNSMMGGIVAIQQVVDTIVWLGAYEKGKTQFGNDADALQYADNMVARTQASGLFSDRTAFERGTLGTNTRQSEFVRMWTVLGSYMFAKANIAYQQTKNTNMRDPVQVLKWAHDMSMLFIFEAIFIGIMRNTLPGEDDEDETVAGFIAKEALMGVLAGMPMMRDLGSTLSGFQGGGALGGFWDTVGKAGVQLSQGEVDAALLKSLNNVGGVIFRYPSGQMNRTAEALWRDMNGEDVEAMDYLIWRQD
jgi:hypothetical protein